MSAPETITSEIQKLASSAVIELFQLDATDLGGDVSRFHSGTNSILGDVVWNGDTYFRFPIQATGFEFSTQGQLPRPKISVSNVLGTVSAMLLASGGLLGAKLTRRRTLAKYLDAINFDGGVNSDADPTAAFAEDIYYVDRVSAENRDYVEFELASPIDLTGIQLPRRQIIQNICPWKYRGVECSYTGTAYFDSADNSVGSLAQDVCGKHLSSCRVRFGQFAQLPFGGFPSAGLVQ